MGVYATVLHFFLDRRSVLPMGKRLLVQRKSRQSSNLSKSKKMLKIAPSSYPTRSIVQIRGYQKCEVKDIVHESGRAAPLAKVEYHTPTMKRKMIKYMVAVEGMHSGMQIALGKKAKLEVGNVLPLSECLEGTPISNIERTPSAGGQYVRAAGVFAVVFAQNKENNTTTVKLPSGMKKIFSSDCRVTIGQIAGAGVCEPLQLKASTTHYRRKAKGKKSVRVRGQAMNPVEHPHGGGNHQYMGRSTCHARAGKMCLGHIAARMTGRHAGKSTRNF